MSEQQEPISPPRPQGQQQQPQGGASGEGAESALARMRIQEQVKAEEGGGAHRLGRR